MRNRGSVVIIEGNQVALIKRVRDGMTYFVFPGGGVENGELPEEAAKREALEELGVVVEIGDCISQVRYEGTQYFYWARMIGGDFGTGGGDEFTDVKKDRGTYEPLWVSLGALSEMDIRPREIADKLSVEIDEGLLSPCHTVG
ncbi:NUDIX hydrolase [Peribacillus kribbensis]|uniref:NUDIX hydrolase n=1 Tax=Peribacillus kribbensis TaxID=356658 RepID=UPI00042599C8|nr:NUDIX domain-containing protein [Peribacillus kribbensis]